MVFAPATRIPFTNRSWAVPKFLSTRPFAWGECAAIQVIPSSRNARPICVGGISTASFSTPGSSRLSLCSPRCRACCTSTPPPRSARILRTPVLPASPKLGVVKTTFLLCSKATLSLCCQTRAAMLTGGVSRSPDLHAKTPLPPAFCARRWWGGSPPCRWWLVYTN